MSQELKSLSPGAPAVFRRDTPEPDLVRAEVNADSSLNIDLNDPDPLADQSAVTMAPDSREITFEGTLRINGYAAGMIRSATGTLIVDAGGEVDADISVYHATIHGCVRGDIYAREKVELGGTAKVIGDIETVALSIEPGAVFEGRCIFVPPTASS